ncbi:hypothetical protein COU54_03650 [Candidatus Pacearchaeota archaeon CG10_big_fil_rev_8_21_14_0_10_31_24]|nr:MAG: hypothetical protein COU54_03650 [Candidatus Pacearchaeota archaeon CG10_big_fil_rev_8_21_14_0_10_31_24]
MLKKKDTLEAIIGLLIIIFLFVLVSYIVQNNLGNFLSMLNMGFISMIIYILIGILATVVAPISATPLIPIATGIWGWFLSGILSIIAWFIGAIIAFWISRKWGVPVVKKFVSLKKLQSYEKMIPPGGLFWTVVLLRILLPVDLLSYALGLFSNISFKKYALATIIGITPFAFIFAYIGTFPIAKQVMILIAILIIVILGILTFIKSKKKIIQDES